MALLGWLTNVGMGASAVGADVQSNVEPIWFDEPAGTKILRIYFTPDQDGKITYRLPRELIGTLLRYSLELSGGSASCTLKLEDQYGHDVFDGAVNAVAVASSPFDGVLTTDLSLGSDPSRGDRPIIVGGPHTFTVTCDADTVGTLELHYTGDMRARYDGMRFSR